MKVSEHMDERITCFMREAEAEGWTVTTKIEHVLHGNDYHLYGACGGRVDVKEESRIVIELTRQT